MVNRGDCLFLLTGGTWSGSPISSKMKQAPRHDQTSLEDGGGHSASEIIHNLEVVEERNVGVGIDR
jgi:hypothetical protein